MSLNSICASLQVRLELPSRSSPTTSGWFNVRTGSFSCTTFGKTLHLLLVLFHSLQLVISSGREKLDENIHTSLWLHRFEPNIAGRGLRMQLVEEQAPFKAVFILSLQIQIHCYFKLLRGNYLWFARICSIPNNLFFLTNRHPTCTTVCMRLVEIYTF